MTTLAFDGRYAAVDGRSCCGGTITGKSIKKLFLINGVLNGKETEFLYMGAGSYAMVNLIKNWLEQGNDLFSQDPEHTIPEIQPDSWEGMIITKDREVFDLEQTLIPMMGEAPCAGGSGFPFALTAMRLGQNAVQAVYSAIEMDCGSGGKVTAFDTEAWQFVEPGDVR
jgi:hypothetical protein